MSVGVITHLRNATIAETRALVGAAEEAGADWIGVPDAFWWRDTWVLLAEAARASRRVELGPLVTNPYTRHPFQTASALATVQELAGERVFLGIGAGGSEVSGAAGISRADAPARIEETIGVVRRVAAGGPLDPVTGRTLEVRLDRVPVLVAGRASRVLEVAGRAADRVLLWAVPGSELERSVAKVEAGAGSGRTAEGPGPERIWAPLVAHDESTRDHLHRIGAYAVLNSSPSRQAAWGLEPELVARIRAALVSGGAAAATPLVPEAAFEDLILPTAHPEDVGRRAAAIGARSIAIPAFDIATVGERVAWAREVTRVASRKARTGNPAPAATPGAAA
jgi:5,10-methylenetetrahydromethanopterin reductase